MVCVDGGAASNAVDERTMRVRAETGWVEGVHVENTRKKTGCTSTAFDDLTMRVRAETGLPLTLRPRAATSAGW